MRKDLAIMGAATDLGQGKAGTELAPSWLRLKGAKEALTKRFYSLEDLGDITPNNHDKTQYPQKVIHQEIARYNGRLSEIAHDTLERDKTLVTFGGDHSIAIGTLSGSLFHDANTKVVWVDAHADLNTPETSPSGNVHGMPLAFFFDLVKDEKMKKEFSWVPHLKKENIVYIGLRDVDPGEKAYIKELGITAFYADEVREIGIEETLKRTLEQINSNGKANVHLSFDVDGLDPEYVPATGTPVEGGLTLLDGKLIINTLFRECQVQSFDLVEVNPMLGTTSQELEVTANSVLQLLDAIPAWDRNSDTLKEIQMAEDERLSPGI